MQRERPQSKLTPEERLMRRIIHNIEMGNETIIMRIRQTLEIDSSSNPTLDQIQDFVSAIAKKSKDAGKHN